MTLLQRLVGEVAVEDGILRPSDAWLLELARGERRIHRELAALVDAPDAAIARMAARRGLLRVRASALVHQFPDAYWREEALRMGQRREDDLEAAVAYVRNPTLPFPTQAADILEAAQAFTSMVGDEDLAAMVVFFSSAPWDEVVPLLDAADAAGGIPVLSFESLVDPPRRDDGAPKATSRLLTALRVAQAFAEQLGRESHLADRPGAGSFGRTLAAVIRTVPTALIDRDAADETTDEWRSIARVLSDWIELADLLRRARAGFSFAERKRLGDLLSQYLALVPPQGRTAGELSELALPIVVARVEQALSYVGAWPPPRNEPLGLYARALLSLWRDLTDERLPKRCEMPGCSAVLSAHRKARLCAEHVAERRRGRVARRKAAAAADH